MGKLAAILRCMTSDFTKNISVVLRGGLGNQLFQYALARSLAIKNNAHIMLDISDYKNNPDRIFKLDHFFIQADVTASHRVATLAERIIDYIKPFHLKRFIFERHSGFDPAVLNAKHPVFLEGYWQNEKYFKDIRSELLQEARLKAPMGPAAQKIADAIITTPTSVSVHIRRGDYIRPGNKERYDTCTPEYYARAMQAISTKISPVHFFIFSDDIEWVKNNITFRDAVAVTYVSQSGIADYEALMLMSMCHHNIIANSSFSWWGAWLNTHDNKIIIAPQQWLHSDQYDTSDVVPKTWWKI